MQSNTPSREKSRQGQIAFEFIVMLGMSMVVLLLFLTMINPIITEKNEENVDAIFQDLGESIQQEVITASVVNPGYIREFDIPPADLNSTIDRYPYTLWNNGSYLSLSNSGRTYEFALPNITGTLRVGSNAIRNVGGEVYVN